MYAIIKAGGKQHKVSPGDVIEIEVVKDTSKPLEFVPLLVVDDKGKTSSDPLALGSAKVKASVVGESRGPKIHVFHYRNKTGYRRKTGHRQHYTSVRIDDISL